MIVIINIQLIIIYKLSLYIYILNIIIIYKLSLCIYIFFIFYGLLRS